MKRDALKLYPVRERLPGRRPCPAAPWVLTYEGYHGCRCHCFLHTFGNLVVVTEAPANPGTSITNMAEDLALRTCVLLRIEPLSLRWVERYAHEDPHADRVTFIWDGTRFAQPKWHRLLVWEVDALRELALPPALRIDVLDRSEAAADLVEVPG